MIRKEPDRDWQNTSMKELPAEFFLPPQTNAALKRETVRLLAVCVAFIVTLGIIVAMTQGIIIKA
ncbi:hypothetical protein O983_24920 [Mycobacterium avium 09-5983]|uniref:Uncharacterized protein n=3 Tax=Mycobacterium avium complex (MAC) TaxID=120793 RepID=A0ABX3TNE2_9MYCO|nr:hypothetical protein O983_24920 [Mycobacterium avium 09-5983]ETB36119.1 hypothetical protein N602_24950 [Mycobacterium avium subsp. hominissuis 10-5606]KDO99393.1 hypothetical protein MAV3388_11040 [Mycobacterium avium subsp. hominissuis 3388]ORA45146.1 hypothetical protein BST19_20585 [Mycobacterium bouchedurhonense]ORB80352.1 hypothetical protein BST46_09490 [Mycobacterium timonense]PBJ59535.1 hypothetical protein BI298_00875 [Mycobacterium avium subsp. hominissuis]